MYLSRPVESHPKTNVISSVAAASGNSEPPRRGSVDSITGDRSKVVEINGREYTVRMDRSGENFTISCYIPGEKLEDQINTVCELGGLRLVWSMATLRSQLTRRWKDVATNDDEFWCSDSARSIKTVLNENLIRMQSELRGDIEKGLFEYAPPTLRC